MNNEHTKDWTLLALWLFSVAVLLGALWVFRDHALFWGPTILRGLGLVLGTVLVTGAIVALLLGARAAIVAGRDWWRR